MKALLIDNYDSFTFNLYHLISEFFSEVVVKRNDEVSLGEIGKYDILFISPGPGRPGVPRDVGVSETAIKEYPQKPIFGVCLGHQIIGYVYGAKIIQASRIMHGKRSTITHNGDLLFKNLKSFKAGRYHSLVLDKRSIPPTLQVLAYSEDGEIMAVKHLKYPHYGVQFHPESILTEHGRTIIENFIEVVS